MNERGSLAYVSYFTIRKASRSVSYKDDGHYCKYKQSLGAFSELKSGYVEEERIPCPGSRSLRPLLESSEPPKG
jgi:hypothetical protein